ncbi:ABC transporter permease [Streptomyces alkaliterrae]|uniref:ABC transporter permease n=1 Tax=Streptomyces alkaliterrae TaxID=2213162 RepID=A0A5P0YMZ2_9ACTN|nr:ABC transporter permease [Streptomyces alkaliterrae]MBB1253911.1 ABC transporter permease [Streptomyces alkaliterrae]MBB1258185.1 ABC transporter permease [Streptomyces alkaliterrae]MQS01655.1 ABC transporter permease subunit [Streptomyces alkaliterrae]
MPDLTKTEETEPVKAPVAEGAPVPPADPAVGKPRSLWSDAWSDLRRSPMFIISSAMILLLLVIAAFPGWFTSLSPRDSDMALYLQKPQFGAFFSPEWLGYDGQGYSVYTRLIHGARNSILIGVSVTVLVTFVGGLLGMLAGYFGGWVDTVISRITDVFLGLPFLLGAMVILVSFETRAVYVIVLALAVLGWTLVARVMRGSVITVKQADYVMAAKALGASTTRILFRHVLPNAVTPVIVVATIALGGYISAEATLSFLGIGLAPPAVSWGVDINTAKDLLRNAPHVLLWPGLMLSFTILAFIMFGEAVRNALDPKLR